MLLENYDLLKTVPVGTRGEYFMNYNKRNILWVVILILMSSAALHAITPGQYFESWIRDGNIDRVVTLIQKYPYYLNSFDLRRDTPVQYAIDNGQYEIARLLINSGANATSEQKAAVGLVVPKA